MQEGIVMFFNERTKLGQIIMSTGMRLYFRAESIVNNSPYLTEGMKVQFEIKPGQQGPEAINVSVIS